MIFTDILQTKGKQLLSIFIAEDERKQLLERLCEQYCAETHNVAQFAAHAERMYYPKFRDRLVRLAVEKQEHVQWLRGQILALRGEVPQPTVSPDMGKNSWKCLSLDVERQKRSYTELKACVGLAMHVDAKIAEGLLRLCAEAQRHLEELRAMWMKSEPGIPPTPKMAHPELKQQKQSWIEQQRSEWFARQLSEWEAKGKSIPWAEWEGELEKSWLVNELPSLELLWARCVAEEEIAGAEKDVGKSPFLE